MASVAGLQMELPASRLNSRLVGEAHKPRARRLRLQVPPKSSSSCFGHSGSMVTKHDLLQPQGLTVSRA